MATKKRWSKEEDNVLIDQVTRHAENLAEAFRVTSRLTRRTVGACAFRWYNVLSKNRETNICFTLVNKTGSYINTKNSQGANLTKKPLYWWKRIVSFLKGYGH